MTVKSRTGILTAVIIGLGMIAPARGQDPATDAQNKLLAKRAAEADCYRKLAETVYGVQINSSTYVRDFVTESDEIRASVDVFVKGIRLGPPRYYDDGTCEVDAEVTVAKLITTLKEIHTAHYKGNSVRTTDFENIKQTVKKDVIQVTGAGVPRPDLPPLPEGYEDVVTSLPAGVPATKTVPPIWKTVPAQARLTAERAAEVVAYRTLLEHIKGVRLNSNTLVRDFVTEYDEISARASGIVLGAAKVSTYLHHDELIVEVTMEVPVEKVITNIKELHTRHYRGNRVTATDIVNIRKTVNRNFITATGAAVPAARYLAQAKTAGVAMPEWSARTIQAIGQGTDPDINTAQGKLKAARAAELDAKRRLAEQVYGLSISSNTSVRDFVTEYDEIATQLEAVLVSAIAEPATFEGDIAQVRVSIPAAEVWSVVHQHMEIVERRG